MTKPLSRDLIGEAPLQRVLGEMLGSDSLKPLFFALGCRHDNSHDNLLKKIKQKRALNTCIIMYLM